jgi:hypothetical protein
MPALLTGTFGIVTALMNICFYERPRGYRPAPPCYCAVWWRGTIITGTGACRRIFDATEPRNT